MKYILTFSSETAHKASIYELIKKFDIQTNILRAEIKLGKGGQMAVSFEAEQEKINQAIEFLKDNGIIVSSMADKVFYDSEKCVNCGNCASSCPSGALSIGAPDWKLVFNPDKCIVCKMCLKSCPLQLFSIELIN